MAPWMTPQASPRCSTSPIASRTVPGRAVPSCSRFSRRKKKACWARIISPSNPTVPKSAIVADLNFDMPLPLWPLKMVYLPGETESTLGADASAVGAQQGIAVVPDPNPDRNVFVRADQYSFVREGVPSLFMKFGFPEEHAGIPDRA